MRHDLYTGLASKMGNSVDQSRALQNTYLPKRAAMVRLLDEARKPGRRVLRENSPGNASWKRRPGELVI